MLPGLVRCAPSTARVGSEAPGGLRCAGEAATFAEPEVQDLGLAPLGNKQVRRLKVAVNDTRGVRYVERVRHLGGEIEQLLDRERLALDAVFERRPFQVLHDNEVEPLLFADIVDGADVGMVQRGCGTRLPLKALIGLWVIRQLFRKELQGDAPAQAKVLGFIDNAHATAAQLLRDAVVRDRLADHRKRKFLVAEW